MRDACISFHAPSFVENDVKCAALAEMKYGLARGEGKKPTLLVWPGSGIGGATIVKGRLHPGSSAFSSEFGHMKIAYGKNARKCGCGKKGCFEAYCGGKGIEKAYFAAFGKRKSAKEIFSSASSADNSYAKDAAHLFGLGLAKIANKLKPSLFVVGGSLSKAYLGKCRQAVLASFAARASPEARKARMLKSRLAHAVLLGANLIQ